MISTAGQPDILSRLEGVRETRNGWEARCPAHDDRKASLCISRGDDGRTLVCCQAKCETEAVVSAIGMTMRDLMPPGNEHARNGDGRPQIVRTYKYADENGNLLFEVCRLDPKDFRQRQPKPGGAWSWSVKGVRRVPYRLPELVQADPQQIVFVPEGEADVDRLIGLDLIATCNAGGAGKWQPGFAEYLRSRRVVILPDNDTPGRRHAQQVAENLLGKALSVKILELPDLKPKGDVSDWLDAGGNAEKLTELSDATPEWEPSADVKDDPAATPDSAIAAVSNARLEKDGDSVHVIPIPMADVVTRILAATDNWPRRVGGALFAHDPRGLHWLESASSLFGWLADRCGIIDWRRAQGCVSKEETYHQLRRVCTQYEAIEQLPHEPVIAGHYYMGDAPGPGDGEALQKLLEFFTLETRVDRQLLLATLATPLWGGPPGTRPAGMMTAKAGRGMGKTTLAEKVARIYGGHIDISPQEDIGAIKSRLLSPEASSKRIALLDNVKTTRFSWGELEALITADTVSGKRMYVGEGQRPNYLSWIITLNGASLSTDMAQRVVEIRIGKPDYDPTWEERTNEFIDGHRENLIADLIGFLRRPARTLRRHSRWAAWESGVLSRVDDPDTCLDTILDRRGEADVEEEEGKIIEDYFSGQLRALDYDPDRDDVFLANSIAASWYNTATGDRCKVAAVSRALRQLANEGRISQIVAARAGTGGERGFRWIGHHADAAQSTQLDLRQRMARNTEERTQAQQDGRF